MNKLSGTRLFGRPGGVKEVFKKIRETFIEKTARKPRGSWAAKHYAQPKAHLYSFRIIMERLNLEAGDRYCEIGCGGGVLLHMAMQRAARGAAIDHSSEMVTLSQEKNREGINRGRLEVVRGNAESLPWDTGSFTACASANMFFFVENPDAVLSEVYRVLAPKGRFAMVTAGKGPLSRLTFGWLYRLNTYTDKAMTKMMQDAGFRRIRVNSGLTGTLQVCCAEK